MCEMLTAEDNSSKCQMVFAKWAGKVPRATRLTARQSFQGGFTLVMTKGKQECVIYDTRSPCRVFWSYMFL